MHSFAFVAHNHPPPLAPPVKLHKRRLLAYEASILPEANPFMIKVRTQARVIQEGLGEGGRSSIGRKAVYVMGRSARESKKNVYQKSSCLVKDDYGSYVVLCEIYQNN